MKFSAIFWTRSCQSTPTLLFQLKIKQLQVQNWLQNQIVACETSKKHLFQTFLFWTSNFEDSPFLSQFTQKRVLYLKRKLCVVANECSFEIGRISIMRAFEIKRVRADLYGSPCIWLFMFKISALYGNPSQSQQNCPSVLPAK